MMNKKAIAAFAAGATLLAGFAMATPAFAAETPNNDANKVLTKKEAKKVAAEKQQAYLKLVQNPVAEAGKDAEAPATSDIAADALKKCYTEDAKTHKFTAVESEINKLTVTVAGKVNAYINGHNAYLAADAAHKKYVDDVAAALKAWTDAEAAVKTAAADPVEQSDDDKKDAAIARVRTAAADLQTKIEKKQKTYAEYAKKKSAYDAAMEKVTRCEKAVKAAQDALDNYEMSGDKDSKREERLNKVLKRAQSELEAATTKQSKAEEEYKDAKKKANAAKVAWQLAVEEYDAAFEHAKSLDIDPAKLPVVSTAADPLDNDFLDLPSTSNGVAPAGKNGAQAGANGAAAGKAGANGSAAAGAKTEVENKNGKDKRGNTHTGTGVGVTLTALAATMLAGMGAAVRKARH
ncbi:hypothetical protein ACLD5Z_04260 [Gardnerella piotii]|uniref:hypothetical protein n=1 Tax=Gardnerella piotii TaxID=2792977 RepID=UPI0039708474